MTSAFVADFLSSVYSSFLRPIVLRRVSVESEVGNRESESTFQKLVRDAFKSIVPSVELTIKDDLDICAHDLTPPRSFVQQPRSFLSRQLFVGVREDEPNRTEEVGLSRTITPDHDIVFRREGVDGDLVTVGLETCRDEVSLFS